MIDPSSRGRYARRRLQVTSVERAGKSLLACVPVVVASIVASCGGSPPPQAMPPERPGNTALVMGVVRDQGGTPVVGAVVAATWNAAAATGSGECPTRSGAPPARTTSDAEGRYSLILSSGVGPDFPACVNLVVTPPHPRFDPAAVRNRELHFRTAPAGGEPRDTLTVDFRLDSRGRIPPVMRVAAHRWP